MNLMKLATKLGARGNTLYESLIASHTMIRKNATHGASRNGGDVKTSERAACHYQRLIRSSRSSKGWNAA
jgi:hypothetical protein